MDTATNEHGLVGSFVLPLTKGHFIQLGNAIPVFPDETDMPVLFYLSIPGSLTAAFLK